MKERVKNSLFTRIGLAVFISGGVLSALLVLLFEHTIIPKLIHKSPNSKTIVVESSNIGDTIYVFIANNSSETIDFKSVHINIKNKNIYEIDALAQNLIAYSPSDENVSISLSEKNIKIKLDIFHTVESGKRDVFSVSIPDLRKENILKISGEIFDRLDRLYDIQ